MHCVIIRASMVLANTGNSIRPTDLQGNCAIPFLSRAACTRQVFVVTIKVFSSGRRISSFIKEGNKPIIKSDLKCLQPSFFR